MRIIRDRLGASSFISFSISFIIVFIFFILMIYCASVFWTKQKADEFANKLLNECISSGRTNWESMGVETKNGIKPIAQVLIEKTKINPDKIIVTPLNKQVQLNDEIEVVVEGEMYMRILNFPIKKIKYKSVAYGVSDVYWPSSLGNDDWYNGKWVDPDVLYACAYKTATA